MACSLDLLRSAAALAHTVPGTVLRLSIDGAPDVLVAHHRPDAGLSPCELRGLVIELGRASVFRRRVISAVAVVGGLEHLGAGVYARRCRGVEERCMVTTVDPERVAELLRARPGVPADAMSARLQVDRELGVTVVRISAEHPLWGLRLDEVAIGVQTELLVGELLAAAS